MEEPTTSISGCRWGDHCSARNDGADGEGRQRTKEEDQEEAGESCGEDAHDSGADDGHRDRDVEDQANASPFPDKPRQDVGENQPGAVQVNEQAPSLNRLLFRGQSRFARARARRARRREGNVENGEGQRQGATESMVEQVVPSSRDGLRDDGEVTSATVTRRTERSAMTSLRRMATLFRGTLETLIEATLVEDVEGEVVVAERVGFIERKWKTFACATVFLLVLLAISLSLLLVNFRNGQEVEMLVPSFQPSLSPTFDPRPTLEIVQKRGYVRCGLRNVTMNPGERFRLNLCRSVAAVAVGDPDSFESVPVTFTNRWQHLLDQTVDLVVLGDAHTIEREVRERSTGVGFTFSSPYTYDGMVYIGNQTFVHCAEEYKRFDECSSLMICVESSTTYYDFLKTAFPFNYLKVGSTLKEITEMLFNDTCNVIVSEKAFIQNAALLNDGIRDGNITLGNKLMTKEPHAIISRQADREFSDIINWVTQSLFFGEEQGLTKDSTLCQKYTDLTFHDISKLEFMNAVYCVGNYGEIFNGDPDNRGMNQINNGTGMLYAPPFGNLGNDVILGPAAGMFAKIKNMKSLTCGVVVPDNFGGNVRGSDKLVGMGVDYCRTLAAALFHGDSEEVNFLTFPETDNSSFIALANGTIDVLVGGRVQRKYDFGMSPSIGGLRFSTPYYYGNESASNGVSFYSMATREDDVLFSSFVNCIVLATIHAQENGIQREKNREMPLTFVFGSDLNWALRDAIAYSGSYAQMYKQNFGSEVAEAKRSRNTLNEGGPLMLSFPHLLR